LCIFHRGPDQMVHFSLIRLSDLAFRIFIGTGIGDSCLGRVFAFHNFFFRFFYDNLKSNEIVKLFRFYSILELNFKFDHQPFFFQISAPSLISLFLSIFSNFQLYSLILTSKSKPFASNFIFLKEKFKKTQIH
jgi:hypothetical protein